MAQKVLSFTFNKKKYVSKPWNFRAACLVQENTVRQMEGKNFGIFSACSDAVDYLFEGTEATSEILDKAVSAKMRMYRFSASRTRRSAEARSAWQIRARL